MSRPKLKVKKGDRVVVIAGRDKGKRGEVLSVIPDENRALVQGVNVVVRHQKQSQQQEGGKISKEAPIHISNIAMPPRLPGLPPRSSKWGSAPLSRSCRLPAAATASDAAPPR